VTETGFGITARSRAIVMILCTEGNFAKEEGEVVLYKVIALPAMQRGAEYIFQVFCTSPRVTFNSFREE